MEEQGLGESGGEEKSNKINLSLHILLNKITIWSESIIKTD